MSENLNPDPASQGALTLQDSELSTENSMFVYVETDIKPEPEPFFLERSSSTILQKPSEPTTRHKKPPPYERCDFCFQLLQPETSVHFDASGQFSLEKKIEFVLATDLGQTPPRCCAHCWHMFELFAGFKRSCLVALRKQEELRAFEVPGGAAQTVIRVVAKDAPARPPKQSEQTPKVMPSGTVTQVRYPCGSCPRTFASKAGLSIHRPQCKKVDKPRFRCKLCPASFPRPPLLQNHINWHNNSKPFRCRLNNCIATFTSDARRNKHEKEVLKDPELRCTICHKKVRVASSMKRHLRQYHKDRNKDSSIATAEETTSGSCDSGTKT
uniref:Zinc finger protein 561 n=1 Tax=Culex pipiens TaxID=7175 RepID=A0A8D8DM83_CULPI